MIDETKNRRYDFRKEECFKQNTSTDIENKGKWQLNLQGKDLLYILQSDTRNGDNRFHDKLDKSMNTCTIHDKYYITEAMSIL